MNYGSASALQPLRLCPGPAVIEHYDLTTEAAEQGTVNHDGCLPWLSSQPGATLPDSDRGRALERLPQTVGEMEVKIAIDPRAFTARLLPTHDAQGQPYGHRDYSAAEPGEIVGTADIWGEPIVELKTGAVDVEADNNYQTLFFALAWWLIYGKLATTRLTKSHVDKAWYEDRTPTASRLMDYRRDLVRLQDTIDAARATPAGERLPLVTGQHCQWCDVQQAGACPAFSDRITQPLTGDVVADAVTAKLAAADTRAQRVLVFQSLGTAVHETDAGTAEPVTDRSRKIADVDAAIYEYPWLAGHVTRTIRAPALDKLIRHERRDGERWDEARDRVHEKLENGGALEWTVRKSWEIVEKLGDP